MAFIRNYHRKITGVGDLLFSNFTTLLFIKGNSLIGNSLKYSFEHLFYLFAYTLIAGLRGNSPEHLFTHLCLKLLDNPFRN